MTQYSIDQNRWVEVPGKFDANKIAHMLKAVRGDYIYYRESDDGKISRLLYIGK